MPLSSDGVTPYSMIKIDKHNRWKLGLLFIAPLIFLVQKFTTAGIRLSDTNLYYSMGEAVLKGRHLYTDIFFTNLPLFPYISAFYTIASGKNLILFYLIGSIEAVICYALIFIIGYLKTRHFMSSLLGALLFLYSFTILYISDSQTGVLTATIFLLLGYLYIERGKNYLYGGVFLALSFVTKAYFAPVIAAFFLAELVHRKTKNMLHLIAGFIGALSLIAGPYLLLAPRTMITQLMYAGMRSVGFPKLELLKYVATFDFVLLVICVSIFYFGKKNMLHLFAVIFFALYFIIRGSIYPIYLCMIIPFLVITAQDILYRINNRIANKKIVPLLVFCYVLSMFFIYVNDYSKLGIIDKVNEIVARIKKEHPSYIYGVADLAPALSQQTGIPLLEGVIDTNAEIFQKGFLNKKILSAQAVKQKTIIVTEGIYMPDIKIDEQMDDNTFDKKFLLKSCKQIGKYPVQGQELINMIYLFKCY